MSIANLSVKNNHTVCCKCFTCVNNGMQFGNDQGTTVVDFNPAGCTMDFANCTVLNFPGGSIGPSPTQTQNVYVSKGGSDITGNGSILNPYATIPKALTSITDASLTKIYIINAGPGQHNGDIHLKPWIAISGENATLLGNVDINDLSWTPEIGNQPFAGIFTCTIVGSLNIDFSVNNILDGQCHFKDCQFITPLNYVSAAVGSSNLITNQCGILVDGFTQQGGSMTFNGCSIFNNTISTILSKTGVNTSFETYGGGCNNDLTATFTPGDGNISLMFLPFSMNGNLILDGASCSLLAPVSSIPKNVTLLNGATINYTNEISLNNPSQWSDVNITSPTSGQVLKYNGTNWVNGTDSTSTGANLGTGNGVYANNSGSILQFKSLSGADLVSISNTGTDITITGNHDSLDGLTDVVITTPSTNQILTYDGSDWINSTTILNGNYVPTISGLSNLGSITALACNYVQVGKNIQVYFIFQATPTNATTTFAFTISLPIPTSFAASSAGIGLCNGPTQSISGAGQINLGPDMDFSGNMVGTGAATTIIGSMMYIIP